MTGNADVRARNVKPSFFQNEELADIPPYGRLLFIGLWCCADREGRLEDRPRRIKACTFPYEEVDCDSLLQQLADKGFIARYEVEGERYIQVTNFTKHQNPHVKESASTIPAPCESGACTVPAPDQHHTSPADSLLLIPDSPSLIAEPPIPPKRKRTGSRTPGHGFAEFWVAYPRKVGKGAAERSWDKIRPNAELTRTILESVAAHRRTDQWRKDGGQYIPLPATWLNQRRWEDEPEPALEPEDQLDPDTLEALRRVNDSATR